MTKTRFTGFFCLSSNVGARDWLNWLNLIDILIEFSVEQHAHFRNSADLEGVSIRPKHSVTFEEGNFLGKFPEKSENCWISEIPIPEVKLNGTESPSFLKKHFRNSPNHLLFLWSFRNFWSKWKCSLSSYKWDDLTMSWKLLSSKVHHFNLTISSERHKITKIDVKLIQNYFRMLKKCNSAKQLKNREIKQGIT